ncbi:uncharacterized protein B0H18DRAFT_395289 [Fomitopsis serialis]|uniref:uncharacterized protein n=1 Tax=Fomitopsis serialis TaxID=139415 RepID=UPI0020081622|nr:uncharacterized protein B0H18DRAFT_395289 [Neoantrodia serialis]KAH9924904.1 hypothetical protein B0H18DRAFT_395289 [Neoantrodia serialis]
MFRHGTLPKCRFPRPSCLVQPRPATSWAPSSIHGLQNCVLSSCTPDVVISSFIAQTTEHQNAAPASYTSEVMQRRYRPTEMRTGSVHRRLPSIASTSTVTDSHPPRPRPLPRPNAESSCAKPALRPLPTPVLSDTASTCSGNSLARSASLYSAASASTSSLATDSSSSDSSSRPMTPSQSPEADDDVEVVLPDDMECLGGSGLFSYGMGTSRDDAESGQSQRLMLAAALAIRAHDIVEQEIVWKAFVLKKGNLLPVE